MNLHIDNILRKTRTMPFIAAGGADAGVHTPDVYAPGITAGGYSGIR